MHAKSHTRMCACIHAYVLCIWYKTTQTCAMDKHTCTRSELMLASGDAVLLRKCAVFREQRRRAPRPLLLPSKPPARAHVSQGYEVLGSWVCTRLAWGTSRVCAAVSLHWSHAPPAAPCVTPTSVITGHALKEGASSLFRGPGVLAPAGGMSGAPEPGDAPQQALPPQDKGGCPSLLAWSPLEPRAVLMSKAEPEARFP